MLIDFSEPMEYMLLPCAVFIEGSMCVNISLYYKCLIAIMFSVG